MPTGSVTQMLGTSAGVCWPGSLMTVKAMGMT
jgi:hypothetical protein